MQSHRPNGRGDCHGRQGPSSHHTPQQQRLGQAAAWLAQAQASNGTAPRKWWGSKGRACAQQSPQGSAPPRRRRKCCAAQALGCCAERLGEYPPLPGPGVGCSSYTQGPAESILAATAAVQSPAAPRPGVLPASRTVSHALHTCTSSGRPLLLVPCTPPGPLSCSTDHYASSDTVAQHHKVLSCSQQGHSGPVPS